MRGIFSKLGKAAHFRERGRVTGSTQPSKRIAPAGRRSQVRRRLRSRPPTVTDLGWPGIATFILGLNLHLSIMVSTYQKVPPEVFVFWLLAACVALTANALTARTTWPIRLQAALLNLLYVPLAVRDLWYLWG